MKKTGEKTLNRRSQLLLFDGDYRKKGFPSLAGVDEAGRGPLAGPVVASAVIVRDELFSSAVDDSKKMTAAARERAYAEIMEKCAVGIGIVDTAEIDRLNILQATFEAMRQALESLGEEPDGVLVDGTHAPTTGHRHFPVVDGDAKSFSIACASIVAKVTRDRIMDYYDTVYPRYGFVRHKGYGTPEHLAALAEHGPCRIHRKSFEPVRQSLKEDGNTSHNRFRLSV